MVMGPHHCGPWELHMPVYGSAYLRAVPEEATGSSFLDGQEGVGITDCYNPSQIIDQ